MSQQDTHNTEYTDSSSQQDGVSSNYLSCCCLCVSLKNREDHPDFAWLTPRYHDHIDWAQSFTYHQTNERPHQRSRKRELNTIQYEVKANDPQQLKREEVHHYYNDRELDAQMYNPPVITAEKEKKKLTRRAQRENAVLKQLNEAKQQQRIEKEKAAYKRALSAEDQQVLQDRAGVIQQNEAKMLHAWKEELKKRQRQTKQQQQQQQAAQ